MPKCEHRVQVLTATNFATWPATETYRCEGCGATFDRPWKD